MDILDKQKAIFGRLFLVSNKLKSIGDQAMGGEMTIRQWLLTVAVAQFGERPPSLSEVAAVMGSSHQNVKQLALKLQETDFLSLIKDSDDLRSNRIKLTEKSIEFWKTRQHQIKYLLMEIFKDLSMNEIDILSQCLSKMHDKIIEMEKVI